MTAPLVEQWGAPDHSHVHSQIRPPGPNPSSDPRKPQLVAPFLCVGFGYPVRKGTMALRGDSRYVILYEHWPVRPGALPRRRLSLKAWADSSTTKQLSPFVRCLCKYAAGHLGSLISWFCCSCAAGGSQSRSDRSLYEVLVLCLAKSFSLLPSSCGCLQSMTSCSLCSSVR